jgi:hypothetical protein
MEFDPIYPAGIHYISFDNLNEIFVTPFENGERRKYLSERFRAHIEKFSDLELIADIWLDGSYLTNKPEPGDMDIPIVFDVNKVNNSPVEKDRCYKNYLTASSKIRYSIDVLLLPAHDVTYRSYWRGWFGFSRNEQPICERLSPLARQYSLLHRL